MFRIWLINIIRFDDSLTIRIIVATLLLNVFLSQFLGACLKTHIEVDKYVYLKTRKSCIFEIDFEVYNVYHDISTLHLVCSSSMVSSSISLYSSSMEYQWFWMISSSTTSTEDETNASVESSDPAKISGIRIVIPKSLIAGSFAYNIFVFC